MAGIGFALVAKQAIQMADAMTNVRNRVRLYTSSVEEANRTVQDLIKRSNSVRIALESTAQLFQRLSSANKSLGLEQKALLDVMDTVNRAIVISGVSADSANAAIIQLGQGLAAGALRGEELNSVMEQTPRLAQALAAGMGIGIGQLRSLGAEGALTAEKVIAALQSQADVINKEFGNIDATVGQAMTVLNNKMLQFVGLVDDATGASGKLARVILTLSENLQAVATVLGVIATLLAARGVESLLRFAAGGAVGGAIKALGGAAASAVPAIAPVAAPLALGGLALNQIAGQFNNGPGQDVPFNRDSGFERTSRTFTRGADGNFFDPNAFVGPRPMESHANSLRRAGAFQMPVSTVSASRDVTQISDSDMAFMEEATAALFEGMESAFDDVSPGIERIRAQEMELGRTRDRVQLATAGQDEQEQILLQRRQSAERITALVGEATQAQNDELAALHTAEKTALDDAQAKRQEVVDKAEADKVAADALALAKKETRDLTANLGKLKFAAAQVSPELASFIGIVQSMVDGDILGVAVQGFAMVADQLFGGVTAAERAAAAQARYNEVLQQAADQANAITGGVGGLPADELIREQQAALAPLQAMFQSFRELRPDDTFAQSLRAWLEILNDAATGDDRALTVRGTGQNRRGRQDFRNLVAGVEGDAGGDVAASVFADMQAAIQEIFGPDTSFADAAGLMFQVERSFNSLGEEIINVGAAAKATVNDLGSLQREVHTSFDVEEIALRASAQQQFLAAGADPFEQAKVFARLQTSIENLAKREAAAARAIASTTTATTSGTTDDTTLTGSLKIVPTVVDVDVSDLTPIDVPWAETITLTVSDLDGFGVDHWSGIIDMEALRTNAAEVQYVIPWSEAVDLFAVSAALHGASHWSAVVDMEELRTDPSKAIPIQWSTVVALEKIKIDDWSDLLNFPALPPALEDIQVGINGAATSNRDLIRIQRRTIDDWSDLLYFPALPSLLSHITVGINNVSQGPRDMIRLQRQVVNSWHDLFLFDLPDPLEIDISNIVTVTGSPRKISITDIVDLSELEGIIISTVTRAQRDRVGEGVEF
jgi:tape measure domain-containing protein